MKNKTNKKSKESTIKGFFNSIGTYIKRKYPFLLILFAGFLAVSVVNFFKISTTDTVASFKLDDFEIGQISDRTIIAEKDLPADEFNPVEIQKGEKIIKKGFQVTEEGYAKLKKMAESPVYLDFRAFADSELFFFVLGIMWYMLLSFLPFGRKIKVSEVILQAVFFILIYACSALCGKLPVFSSPFSLCVVLPTSLCVLLLAILYGQLPSVIFSFVTSLAVLNGSGWEVVPFLYTLSTCLYSAAIVRKIERRIDMIFASIVIALLNVVFILLLAVVFNENIRNLVFAFGGVALNGFLSGILALGLLTPLELMLNTASVFRLMDLSDLNNPLMKSMLVQASGTYQHSLMVAQLAENACREIRANALVARVGAYFHDIGKIEQSQYFVENQKGENKHDEINPSLSVSVIRSHVKKGVEKARQLRLPQVIIDIIAEHHGNSVIAYFYNEAKEKDPTLSPEDFSYTGNPPTTRESAVVMLADTVEAACRTLENPSVPRLEKFIGQLVQGKIDHNQMDNCDLTFRDITKIKESFVQILAGFYHSRIEYPDQEGKKDSEKKDEKKDAENKSESKKDDSKPELKSEPKKDADSKKDSDSRGESKSESKKQQESDK